ncbi:MAG: hypothetical protein QW666_00455 [Candidatus Woesearchaeota archaeon]
MESDKLLLGMMLVGITGLVLMIQSELTGKFYYRTPNEACATYISMCEDGLPPVFTGNVDEKINIVECRCVTNPYKTGWRSLVIEYGKVSS